MLLLLLGAGIATGPVDTRGRAGGFTYALTLGGVSDGLLSGGGVGDAARSGGGASDRARSGGGAGDAGLTGGGTSDE
ncbi:MAG: hypothetical protein RJB26_2151 [Pseudomonadota bacterium]|jgi:hypothetical protein